MDIKKREAFANSRCCQWWLGDSTPQKLPGTSLKYNKGFFDVVSWPPWSLPVHTVVLRDHASHGGKTGDWSFAWNPQISWPTWTHPYSPLHYCWYWQSPRTIVLVFLFLLVKTPLTYTTELEEMIKWGHVVTHLLHHVPLYTSGGYWLKVRMVSLFCFQVQRAGYCLFYFHVLFFWFSI